VGVARLATSQPRPRLLRLNISKPTRCRRPRRRTTQYSRHLRGIVYRPDIDSWTRANARRSAEAHKRAEIRGELQSKVIAEMVKSLSSGVPKERAMEKAFKAGAYRWQIS
jgi:hypothetical protein